MEKLKVGDRLRLRVGHDTATCFSNDQELRILQRVHLPYDTGWRVKSVVLDSVDHRRDTLDDFTIDQRYVKVNEFNLDDRVWHKRSRPTDSGCTIVGIDPETGFKLSNGMYVSFIDMDGLFTKVSPFPDGTGTPEYDLMNPLLISLGDNWTAPLPTAGGAGPDRRVWRKSTEAKLPQVFPGLPKGYAAVAWRVPKEGESYLVSDGTIRDSFPVRGTADGKRVIVTKYQADPRIKLPGVPEGFEAVRFGPTQPGDLYVANSSGKVAVAFGHNNHKLVVQKTLELAVGTDGVLEDLTPGIVAVCWGIPEPGQRFLRVNGTTGVGPERSRIHRLCVKLDKSLKTAEFMAGYGAPPVAAGTSPLGMLKSMEDFAKEYAGGRVPLSVPGSTRNDGADATAYAYSLWESEFSRKAGKAWAQYLGGFDAGKVVDRASAVADLPKKHRMGPYRNLDPFNQGSSPFVKEHVPFGFNEWADDLKPVKLTEYSSGPDATETVWVPDSMLKSKPTEMKPTGRSRMQHREYEWQSIRTPDAKCWYVESTRPNGSWKKTHNVRLEPIPIIEKKPPTVTEVEWVSPCGEITAWLPGSVSPPSGSRTGRTRTKS